MPDWNLYLEAFGIIRGLQVGNYTVTNVTASRHQIIKYRKYEYQTNITFTPLGQPNTDQLLSDLEKKTKGPRIVQSPYGNPYQAVFTDPHIKEILPNGQVIITSTGYANRMFSFKHPNLQ